MMILALIAAAAFTAAAAAPASNTVDLYSCGRPDCATVPPNSVCGMVAHALPTDGTCTWSTGAYCFSATMDADGLLSVRGYPWVGSCACGGSLSWGSVSGINVNAGLPSGCEPVQGGYGGGAFANWTTGSM